MLSRWAKIVVPTVDKENEIRILRHMMSCVRPHMATAERAGEGILETVEQSETGTS